MERCIAKGLFHGVHRLSLPPQRNFRERLHEKGRKFARWLTSLHQRSVGSDVREFEFELQPVPTNQAKRPESRESARTRRSAQVRGLPHDFSAVIRR